MKTGLGELTNMRRLNLQLGGQLVKSVVLEFYSSEKIALIIEIKFLKIGHFFEYIFENHFFENRMKAKLLVCGRGDFCR